MELKIEVLPGQKERWAEVIIPPGEVARVYLNLAFPEGRNRTGRYMRRHPHPGETVDPNKPVRDPAEPPKVPITTHLDHLQAAGALQDYHLLPPATGKVEDYWGPPKKVEGETFWEESARLVVPISDLPANLLRPCFHRDGLGGHRLFFLQDEPIAQVDSYWCLCFWDADRSPRLTLQWVHFDAEKDLALEPGTDTDLIKQGLVWAAALVPLVVDHKPCSAAEIACRDYDLRQIFGRQADKAIQGAYAGWYGQWEARVKAAVAEHESQGRPFATFYHSILALAGDGTIHIIQKEGTLPGLAQELAYHRGLQAAGLLDSGGSCALYDPRLGSYLNHSWYFREDRGAVLLFELNQKERLPNPAGKSSWIQKSGRRPMKKVTMIGTGYVGLVTGACLARVGHRVICADIDADKIKMLNRGLMPIYEPGLEEYVKAGVQAGRLSFTTDVGQAVQEAEIVFIAVGTPPKPSGSADLSFVWQAAQTIGQNLNDYKVIVDKSTVPVHTAAEVRRLIERELRQAGTQVDFDVVSNPEFLREGCAIDDFMKPDRIVVGSNSERAAQVMAELYKYWTDQNYPLVFMDVTSAEMTKYAANAFLATKISFINEIANICEGVGANVDKVREGIGLDKRIGPHFLYPGLGYGGSCFPKDVMALVATSKDTGYIPRLLEAVDLINHDQRLRFIAKIRKFFGYDLRDKVLALWGLSFKPDTDDIREAPALTIMEELLPEVAGLRVFCPVSMPNVKNYFASHRYRSKIFFAESFKEPLDNAYLALEGAEALILNTEYKLFRDSDPQVIASKLKQKVVFDGRNVFDPQKMRALGFTYFSIGRP